MFTVKWDKDVRGASFSYSPPELVFGTKETNDVLFMFICHELWEICAIELKVRLSRPDCSSDFIFVYDHRQHDTMADMFASLIKQFIK